MAGHKQRRPVTAPAPESKHRLRLWLRLLRASRAIESELRERLRANFHTTLPRFDVMAALARQPSGLTMTGLSRSLMVSNGNVTGIVDRLAAEGIVVRLADEQDGRATVVRLAPNGLKLFAAMAEAHEAWVAEILSTISHDDAGDMIELLNRITRTFPAGDLRP